MCSYVSQENQVILQRDFNKSTEWCKTSKRFWTYESKCNYVPVFGGPPKDDWMISKEVTVGSVGSVTSIVRISL